MRGDAMGIYVPWSVNIAGAASLAVTGEGKRIRGVGRGETLSKGEALSRAERVGSTDGMEGMC